jgi:hypothetical protein
VLLNRVVAEGRFFGDVPDRLLPLNHKPVVVNSEG